MDGFEVDSGQFGLMIGKMNEIGESLGTAAKAFNLDGVDLGHAGLNTAAGQLMTGLGTQFGQFHEQALHLGESLTATQQSYAGLDADGVVTLSGVAVGDGGSPLTGAPAGGGGDVTSGSSPALQSGQSDPSIPIPYAGTGTTIGPDGGLAPIIEN